MPRPHSAAHPPRQDLYNRVTASIIVDLELGVRAWVKPWSAEHLAGRISSTAAARSTSRPSHTRGAILF